MPYMTKDSWPGKQSEPTANEKALWDRQLKLCNQCKLIAAFEHEGRIFLGNYVQAVKNFMEDNPLPADFSVYLQTHYKELTYDLPTS